LHFKENYYLISFGNENLDIPNQTSYRNLAMYLGQLEHACRARQEISVFYAYYEYGYYCWRKIES